MTMFTVMGIIAVSPKAQGALFQVNQSVWGTPSSVGTMAWAIDQANTNPGDDVISVVLTSGSTISVDEATPVSSSFLSTINGTVRIEGNGVTLLGNPSFVSIGGTIYDKFTLSRPTTGDIVTQAAFSFAEVASGVSVTINNLGLDGLNGFLEIGENGSATVTNSTIKNSVFYGYGAQSVINAKKGSTVNLTGVLMNRINPLFEVIPSAEYAWQGAIGGNQATLNMIGSTIQGTSSSLGSVNWYGGTANIVSSIFIGNAGGLSITDDGGVEGVLNFVNSLFRPDNADSEVARIQSYAGGVANLIASTVQINGLSILTGGVDCSVLPGANNYRCNGAPLSAFNGGTIHLKESAVSAINMDLPGIARPYSETFEGLMDGDLTADPLSYVQPTSSLSDTALKTLFNQPSLLTSPDAFKTDSGGLLYLPLPAGAYPVVSGPLLSAIPDAGLGGTNELINPIDGLPITTDVYGNPRTNTLGYRDIGAVQVQVPEPSSVPGVLASVLLLGLASFRKQAIKINRKVQ